MQSFGTSYAPPPPPHLCFPPTAHFRSCPQLELKRAPTHRASERGAHGTAGRYRAFKGRLRDFQALKAKASKVASTSGLNASFALPRPVLFLVYRNLNS